MYRAKVVNYINSFLISEGFHLKKEEDKTAEQLYYSKIKNDITIGVRFLSIIYETNHFYGFVNCNQIVLIENIVAKILYKNKITAVKPKDIYNTIMTRNYKKYRLPTEGILIDSERKVIEICNLFDQFYYEYFTPFYEKWKDLTVLYEYIKDKTEEELWDILGQFAPMKKAVILRLCNDCNYQDFMNDYYEKQKEYYEEDPEDIDNIRYYNAAKELKEVLDKTAPIYNV
ncbi:hypothetical protein ACT4R9_03735 [Ornithobacterium rhinotracheale]|uniref:hypothetical protein n=1 Tax=Ornithobacterium rhinotracheale TaxID=28251 RepID=UPI003FD36490